MTRRSLLGGEGGRYFGREKGLSVHDQTGMHLAIDVGDEAHDDEEGDRGSSPLDVYLEGDEETLTEPSVGETVPFIVEGISVRVGRVDHLEDTSPMEVEYEPVSGVELMDIVEDMQFDRRDEDEDGNDEDESADQAGAFRQPSFDIRGSVLLTSPEEDEEEEEEITDRTNIQPNELDRKRKELIELDEKIHAKKEAIATADAKPGLRGFFSRSLRGLSGAKAADQKELDQLLAERAVKQAELEVAAPAQEEPVKIAERIPETGISAWIARKRNRILGAIGGLAAALTVANYSMNQSQDTDSSEGSTPSALSAPKFTPHATPEAVNEVETPSPASAEVAPETQPTLWAKILEQANGNELQAAQAKKDYLQKNGASIVDSVEPDWLDGMEVDAQLWKDIIRPNLKKWGFSHPSLGMAADIESAQTLRDLLNEQRNNANWLEAEAVLMFQPDAWKNLKSSGSVETDDSADQTTPDIQENLGDDIDLAPFVETPEPARPTQTPWYFDMDDGIISPSINEDEDENEDDEDEPFMPHPPKVATRPHNDEDDIVLPEPDDFDDIAPEDLQRVEFGPLDAPEPVAFIQARNKA